jgi:hypothetical protein
MDQIYGMSVAGQEVQMTRDELLKVLTRYEGAIQEVNDDQSEASMLEMDAAREALMDVLLEAKTNLSE